MHIQSLVTSVHAIVNACSYNGRSRSMTTLVPHARAPSPCNAIHLYNLHVEAQYCCLFMVDTMHAYMHAV